MKRIIIIIFIFVLCCRINVFSQKHRLDHFSIALTTLHTNLPFGSFSNLFIKDFHPGFEIGTGFNWKTKPKHDWFQEFKLAYFYHRFVQHGIPLYTDIGYRYKFSRAISAQISCGTGYMQSIPATAKLKLGANGEYKKNKSIGRSQAIAVVSFSIGYTIHSSEKNAPRVFATYQQFLQAPFVKTYVPILPYNSLLIGCGIPFRSHRKTIR